jgi:hypothetical protein
MSIAASWHHPGRTITCPTKVVPGLKADQESIIGLRTRLRRPGDVTDLLFTTIMIIVIAAVPAGHVPTQASRCFRAKPATLEK